MLFFLATLRSRALTKGGESGESEVGRLRFSSASFLVGKVGKVGSQHSEPELPFPGESSFGRRGV